MNEIVNISAYSERTARVTIMNPNIARKCVPGQFVIIKFSKDGHRIPFSIIDADREAGTLDIIIHRADGLEHILSMIHIGESLPDLLGPLGNGAVINRETDILFFGDGAGVVPLLPLMNYAKRLGCSVMSVLSEESSRTQCLLSEIEREAAIVETVKDGDLISTAIDILDHRHIDKVFMAGPSLMMKRLAAETARRGIASDCVLNMLMIDGIGLCGICRVTVDGEQKQTCTDGPIFDAHKVDFDQLFNRQRLFV